MSYEIRRGHDDLRLEISARRPLLEVAIANAVHRVAELSDADGRFTIDVDGRVFSGWRLITSDRIEIRLDGRSFVFDRREGVARSDAMAGSGDEVRAEMPGTLVARHVDVGAQVQRAFGEIEQTDALRHRRVLERQDLRARRWRPAAAVLQVRPRPVQAVPAKGSARSDRRHVRRC